MSGHPWIGRRVKALNFPSGVLVAIGETLEERDLGDGGKIVVRPVGVIATDNGSHIETDLIYIQLEDR